VVTCASHTLGFGATDLIVGVNPNAVVRADFNGDGFEDLAALNVGSQSVTVLLGFGDGTFATPQSYSLFAPSATSGQLMVSADFNGDGHPDLAVVESGSRVQIFAGSSSGTLAAQTPITLTGGSGAGLAAGDFNGDGKPDLAVFETSTGQIAILTNTGGFAFSESDQSLLSGTPVALAAADVDGDGRIDLVAALATPKELVVIQNKTSGFSPLAPVTLPQTPSAIAVTDLNGDGKVDALAGCQDGSVELLVNSGGTLGAPSSIGNVGALISQLGSGDINGDARPDIVAITTTSLAVLPSTGAATWGSPTYFMPGAGSGLVVGDLNGDGRADVAIGDNVTKDVTVLLAAPVTMLTGPTYVKSVQTFTEAVFADVNGDGHLDAIAVSNATDEVGVFLNNGDGSIAPVVTYGVGTGAAPKSVAVGDFNGDGHLDLAVSSPGLGSISVLLGTATGFGPVKQVAAANNTRVLVGDFNNDGKADLLGYGTSGISVLPGTGTGTFGAAVVQTSVPQGIQRLAIAKVNKDQSLDLVGVTSPYVSAQGQYIAYAITLLGNGDGTFGGGSQLNLSYLGGNPTLAAFVATGDFNNDTNTDVAVYIGVVSGQPFVSYLAGDGTGTLTSKGTGQFGTMSGIAAGDFDGDGNIDLAMALTGGATQGFEILTGNGAWTFANSFFRTASITPQTIAAGDLAGDGRPSLFYGATTTTPGTAGAGVILNLCK
jgi:hypothetical protein